MKTYKMLGTSKGGVIPVSRKGGEWVSAEVAQGLYDALEMVLAVHYGGESRGRQASCPVYAHARAALTAADGDGGDDD